MKKRPILFSAPMVRAILAGTKTQTRRVVKPEAAFTFSDPRMAWPRGIPKCRYGQPGDQLWVRETHFINDFRVAAVPENERADCEILYRATDQDYIRNMEDTEGLVWSPSIHMPRWASRITLEITGVRIERLHDISESDALAEGISPEMDIAWQSGDDTPVGLFGELWESINGANSWDEDPWVWVIEFKTL